MAHLENPDNPTVRTALAPMVSMTLFQATVSMSVLTLPVFAVPLAADLGVTAGWVGLYMSGVFTVGMVGAVIGGQAVRRLGAIRLAQVSLLLAAAGLAVMTAGVLIAVCAAAMILGAAYGPPTPASSHLLARTTPRRLMPVVFSVKQTGVPAGGALAGLLVAPMTLMWGWRGAASAVALLCLVVALGLQLLRRRLDADRDRAARIGRGVFEPLVTVLGAPALRRMALLSFAYSAVQMSLFAYLVTYLVEAVGLDLVRAGIVLFVAQAAGAGGRIFWGAACGGPLTPRRVLIGLGLAMAAASVATAQITPDWPLAGVYVVAGLYGATAVGWNGVFLAELARVSPPGQAGTVAGGTVFVTFGGVVTAPALFSALVASGFGYASGFWMLATLALGGAALLAPGGGQPAPASSR